MGGCGDLIFLGGICMEAKEVILRSLTESQGFLNRALDGLTKEEVTWKPRPESNNIIFLFWHLIRVEDLWISRVMRQEKEVYEVEGWQEKLGTPAKDSGYKYTLEQLQAWPVPELETLWGYAASVRKRTMAFLQSLTPEKLSEVIKWDTNSETAGVMLTHLVTEIALHTGQMAYLHGVLRGMDSPDQRYW
jgi:uncharacterized damage-inducible protein DinB